MRPWPYGWSSSGGLVAAISPNSTTIEARTSPANSTPVANTDVDCVISPTAMFIAARQTLAKIPASATR